MTNEEMKIELQNIEDELQSHHMSCIIGAGFSKNAIAAYPNWNQLLYPMMWEMYDDIIWQKMQINTGATKEQICDRIIAEKGILQVPEDYVHLKNSREALDSYIEQQIGQYIDSPNANLTTHELLLELPWEDVITTNWDNLLEKANENIPTYEKYTKVIDAKGLVNPSHKRIIKIHGSIEKGYAFDNSFKHKYIVSKDDYATYHTEHEDFSNFMRVKILENSLCLIGFSGSDQNFRYWIGQLRKTMTKGGNTGDSNKIYLIDYSDTVEKGDEMFFANNYITRLSVKDITAYLTSIGNYNASKNAFQNLFLFLNNKSPYKRSFVDSYLHNFELFNYEQFVTVKNLDDKTQDMLRNSDITKWENTDFTFLYEFCMNNFYSLEDVLGNEDRISAVSTEYLARLENGLQEMGLSELILKFYRESSQIQKFAKLRTQLQKIDGAQYILDYQKALYYFQKFDYKKFKRFTSKMLANIGGITDSLFVVRIIVLQQLLDAEPFVLEEKEKDVISSLFKRAESQAKSKQLSYFIYLFHRSMHFKDLSFNGDVALDNRLSGVKGQVAALDSFFERMNLKQKLNFLEYTGMPVRAMFEKNNTNNNLEHFIHEANINTILQIKLFLYTLSFYGQSADEKELQRIVPQFLRKFNEETLDSIFEGVFSAIQTKLDAYENGNIYVNSINPKVYIFMIVEVMKRMDKAHFEEFITYFFEKVKAKNILVDSGIRKGNMWGWKKPFEYFCSLITDSDTYTWVLEYVMEEYLADKKEIFEQMKSNNLYKITGFISPSVYYEYYLTLMCNDNFGDERTVFFNRADIQKKLEEDFNLQKELCLASFDYLNDELKVKIQQHIENEYTDKISPWYLRYAKTNVAKEHCLTLLLNYDLKYASGDNVRYLYAEIVSGFVEAFEELITADDKKSLMDSLHQKLDDDERAKGFIFSMFMKLYTETEIQNDANLKQQYDILFAGYKQQNQDLLDNTWMYGMGRKLFATNCNRLFTYASYLPDISEVSSSFSVCFSRLLFEDAEEFSVVFESIKNSLSNQYIKPIYKNEEIKRYIGLLQQKFKKNIPLCYNDILIRDFINLSI